MTIRPNMRNVSILLADSDICLAQAVMHNLRAMGFSNITHVKTSADAVQAIRSQAVSFLITEWDIKGTSGVELVRYLRRSDESPNRGIPIIMLTGRGELTDVQSARDVGITEFVVKPFSAQTLFSRIEQIIDHPRPFVVAKEYVGPERRRRGLPPPGVADRRTTKPIAAVPSREGLKTPPGSPPVIFAADFAIRHQVGGNRPLTTIITPDILKDAQKAIDGMAEESFTWIREDLKTLQDSSDALKKLYSGFAFDAMKAATLSIKARAGTFGYRMASDVARLFFLFLTTDFKPTNPRHLIVIEKHVQVLMIIFAQKIKERQGVGADLYVELERLISVNR
jgi:CheY-like chemotaxis protein